MIQKQRPMRSVNRLACVGVNVVNTAIDLQTFEQKKPVNCDD